ncbi:MAG TPA: PEP/pyruvate-binding domain-containing protein, partial [Candidatus Obscuribacterales bacterium]
DSDSPEHLLPRLGGKAGNLWRLSQAELPVPPWCCVDAGLYTQVRNAIQPQLEGLEPGEFARQGQALLAEHFPWPQLEAALAERLDPDARYAVRSSASSEDSPRDSFAGQFESWLHVPASEVLRHVLFCWQSAFAPRLLVYLHERGVEQEHVQMAVVIQAMVESTAAGVMFMANPVGALTEVVISAGFGLGEGVVSDSVETDTYIYDRLSRNWNYKVLPKQFQVSPGHFGGTERTLVPPELQHRPVLDTEQCQTLLELGQQVGSLYDLPQDLEWAQDRDGRFWLLQTRPITTLPTGETSIFDNSNVVESYPGLTSPLTFSWISDSYAVLFRNGVRRLGVPEKLLADEESSFVHMLGQLQGRVYYNLSSWYRMFRLIPGTEKYIQVWEEMMGIRQPSQEAADKLPWQRFLLPWLGIGARLLWYFLTLDRQLKAFRRHFARIANHFWVVDHATAEPHVLLRTYQQLRRELLPDWDITLLNDGYAFIFSGLTKHLLKQAGIANPDALFNDLLCGVADMESVEPVHSVLALAAEVRREPALREALQQQFLKYDPVALEQAFPAFFQQLATHLQRYGDRSLAELKLETLTLREDPRLLLQWILDYVPTALTLSTLHTREHQIRSGAEERLRSESKLNLLLKLALAFCLAQARRCINYRESSRLDRARAFGMLRRLFRSLGAQLQARHLLTAADDVFFLTLAELDTLVFGNGLQLDWRGLIASRQALYQAWGQQALPERIICQGPIGQNLIPVRRALRP